MDEAILRELAEAKEKLVKIEALTEQWEIAGKAAPDMSAFVYGLHVGQIRKILTEKENA